MRWRSGCVAFVLSFSFFPFSPLFSFCSVRKSTGVSRTQCVAVGSTREVRRHNAASNADQGCATRLPTAARQLEGVGRIGVRRADGRMTWMGEVNERHRMRVNLYVCVRVCRGVCVCVCGLSPELIQQCPSL
ncbi:hypothetical protein LY78DRAFT_85706 [Colletotrichum sublineola]|nr:hypothetical protein LY78DRAFT_85706 [Colletotrichum sublineola]